MSTTSTAVIEIYRNLGRSLELFSSSETELERNIWEAESNYLLEGLAQHTGEKLSITEFSKQWFIAEFKSRI